MRGNSVTDERKLTEFRKAVWIAAADNYERIYGKELASENLLDLTRAVDDIVKTTGV